MTDFFCNGGYISFTGLSILVCGSALIAGLTIILFSTKKKKKQGNVMLR